MLCPLGVGGKGTEENFINRREKEIVYTMTYVPFPPTPGGQRKIIAIQLAKGDCVKQPYNPDHLHRGL